MQSGISAAPASRSVTGRPDGPRRATTGWHRKHAVRALSTVTASNQVRRRSTARHSDPGRSAAQVRSARDALIALWEASDRVCGKRNVAMVPALLPALERQGRLQPTSEARGLAGLRPLDGAETGRVVARRHVNLLQPAC